MRTAAGAVWLYLLAFSLKLAILKARMWIARRGRVGD